MSAFLFKQTETASADCACGARMLGRGTGLALRARAHAVATAGPGRAGRGGRRGAPGASQAGETAARGEEPTWCGGGHRPSPGRRCGASRGPGGAAAEAEAGAGLSLTRAAPGSLAGFLWAAALRRNLTSKEECLLVIVILKISSFLGRKPFCQQAPTFNTSGVWLSTVLHRRASVSLCAARLRLHGKIRNDAELSPPKPSACVRGILKY